VPAALPRWAVVRNPSQYRTKHALASHVTFSRAYEVERREKFKTKWAQLEAIVESEVRKILKDAIERYRDGEYLRQEWASGD